MKAHCLLTVLFFGIVSPHLLHGMETTNDQKQEVTAVVQKTKRKKWEIRTDFDLDKMNMIRTILNHKGNKKLYDSINKLKDLEKDGEAIKTILLEGSNVQNKSLALYFAHALQRPYFLITTNTVNSAKSIIKLGKAAKITDQKGKLPVIIALGFSKILESLQLPLFTNLLEKLATTHLVVITEPAVAQLPDQIKKLVNNPLWLVDSSCYSTVFVNNPLNKDFERVYTICKKQLTQPGYSQDNVALSCFSICKEISTANKPDKNKLDILELVFNWCIEKGVDSACDLDPEIEDKYRDYYASMNDIIINVWKICINQSSLDAKDYEQIFANVKLREWTKQIETRTRTNVFGSRTESENVTYSRFLDLGNLKELIAIYKEQKELLTPKEEKKKESDNQ